MTQQRPTLRQYSAGMRGRSPSPAAREAVYDEDGGGGMVPVGLALGDAEACKIKDALFLGNVMAVQDANFVMMNKIGFCIKCQTGFPVPQHLRRMGVSYTVSNLLGAFMDQSLSVEKKDALLEAFFNRMEDAAEMGMSVLLYSFEDFVWPCFCVVAYWMRKYRWTVEHAVAVMKSRRPDVIFEQSALSELSLLAERISQKHRGAIAAEEESVITHTFANAQGLQSSEEEGSSPATRARPITAHTGRIKWQAGNGIADFCAYHDLPADTPIIPPKRSIIPILRTRRTNTDKAVPFTPARFLDDNTPQQ
eukprot:CAMPEP_0206220718 /NCGR_PEP_ID=MMETSP0047_2-20121206/5028_1 /ASSEMBLY_ACC=CAM_ASM_000192 /TAXON_ID=195065 /ORGANISM="Chroomonas mesostigmatica_cf, Strain CCMP1168" /LENGTH=306 /DNA_ID=CAMNT_0053643399 /DNA_START=71 /DNA_END=989 /DNA_ORIENTATION=-